MRRKRLIIPLIAIAICAVGIGTAGSKGKLSARNSPQPIANSKAFLNLSSPRSAAVVDGASNPELIPDQVAYTLLFRLLSDRHTAEEKNAARSYLKMTFGCGDCNEEQQRRADRQINAFLVVVKQFEQRVGNLDRQAQELQDLNGPNPSRDVLAQLNELESQKEAIVSQLIDSLPNHLDEDGMTKLHRHLNGRVKPKVKMTAKGRQSNCLSCHIYQ